VIRQPAIVTDAPCRLLPPRLGSCQSLSSRLRARLLPTWLSVTGLVAAGVFALGSMSSVLGRTAEGNSSLFGVGLFIVWLLLVALCLWQAAGTAAPASYGSEPE
jgi:hypothetical protein